MNLKNRLKKISPSQHQSQRVVIVKYPAELMELSCGSQKFDRQHGETSDDFIFRVKELILQRQFNLKQIILVGNF